jgi:DNA-cytosine methyltransferase
MDARKKVDKSSFTMVDLFCGAGGLSLGFTQEGFVTRLANDIQECCVDTYAHNHPETPRNRIILGDIKEVADNLESIMHGDKPSIVVGGPPCQGFSEANRQRLIDDPRNYLYKSFVAVVQKLQPPFFVMENVKGMLKVKAQVIEDFNKIGYEAEAYVLNAKDFGVPQNRERIYIVAFKDEQQYHQSDFPLPIALTTKLSDIIDFDRHFAGFLLVEQSDDNDFFRAEFLEMLGEEIHGDSGVDDIFDDDDCPVFDAVACIFDERHFSGAFHSLKRADLDIVGQDIHVDVLH